MSKYFYDTEFIEGRQIKRFKVKKRLKINEIYNNLPKETNTHHALDDAKWGKELYHYIQKL